MHQALLNFPGDRSRSEVSGAPTQSGNFARIQVTPDL